MEQLQLTPVDEAWIRIWFKGDTTRKLNRECFEYKLFKLGFEAGRIRKE